MHNKIFKTEFPFTLLSKLTRVEQSPIHHPEGNVWNHTMMVVENAAMRKDQSEDKNVFMWSALLHDIGKTETTKIRNGKITAYDHDNVGANLVIDFLSEFYSDESFITKVSAMVRWHMQLLYVVNNLSFANIDTMKKQVSINEIALLGLCDRSGRGNLNTIEEEKNVLIFLKKCNDGKNYLEDISRIRF
jgi:tRNA nucleotidyltransferase (CCA-adding enzyme)